MTTDLVFHHKLLWTFTNNQDLRYKKERMQKQSSMAGADHEI